MRLPPAKPARSAPHIPETRVRMAGPLARYETATPGAESGLHVVETNAAELISKVNLRIASAGAMPRTWPVDRLALLVLVLAPGITGGIELAAGAAWRQAVHGIALAFAASLVAAVALLLSTRSRRRRRIQRRAIELTSMICYDMDPAAQAIFGEIQSGCYALACSASVWALLRPARPSLDEKKRATASALRRKATVGKMTPPYLATNIDVWGIDAVESQVYFFPDHILAFREERYTVATYREVAVRLDYSDIAESGAAPADAEVVGHTVVHTAQSPGPDLAGRPETIVRYAQLSLQAASGFEIHLQVSNQKLAERFCQVIEKVRHPAERPAAGTAGGAAHPEPEAPSSPRTPAAARLRERRPPPPPRPAPPPAVVAAYRVLGVGPTANSAQVRIAYRRMAKMYHPDAVSHLNADLREVADLKMKEINAAYAALRRGQR